MLPQFGWGLSGLRRIFSGYVIDLPVTTEIAVAGGVQWFNFPKYLADISFRETLSHRICTVRDAETKDMIVELEGRRIPDQRLWGSMLPETLRTFDVILMPHVNGSPRKARMRIQMEQFAMTAGFGASVRFGDSARAATYSEAVSGPVSHYLFAPKCRGILFEPEEF